MKRLLLGMVIGSLGLFAYQRAHRPGPPPPTSAPDPAGFEQPVKLEAEASAPAPDFHCDGRTRCAEMSSCEEAVYFLHHCPGVKMDGDGDDIPCEDQWCR
jgi:hypothetical protein